MEDISCITRTAEIGRDSLGFIRIRILPGSVLDDADAIDNFLVIKNLSDNQKQLKLIDVRGNSSMTKKAKEVSRKNISPANTIARAYLTDSFLSKLLYDFLQKFTTPEVPQKFFTDEKEAIEWLLSKKP